MDNHPNVDQLTRRITNLEMELTHHQQMLEDLNQVVIEQAKSLKTLQAGMERLRIDLEQTRTATNEPRSLVDDKPPHY